MITIHPTEINYHFDMMLLAQTQLQYVTWNIIHDFKFEQFSKSQPNKNPTNGGKNYNFFYSLN